MIDPQVKPRDGDYVVTRASDTPEQRADAERVLRANGCRQFRAEVLDDGRMIVHGYLRGGA
jgi:hypothetical protein